MIIFHRTHVKMIMNSKFEEIILSRAWTGRLLMKVLSAEKNFWI